MKKKIAVLLFFSMGLFSFDLMSQQGKDLSPTISATNTVVNIYTTLTNSVAANSTNVITVGSAAGITAGDLIYVIQMQGATVNGYTYLYGDSLYCLPTDTSSGKIKAYGSTGNNEFAEVTSVAGNVITLDCQLKNSYGDSVGGVPKVQVIRVPRYASLNVTGSITCQPWNGSTGGIVVIEVQGNTTITGSIDVSAKGFRGGSVMDHSHYASTATDVGYAYTSTNTRGGHKGESIVGDTNVYNRKTMGNYDWGTAFWLSNPMALCKGNVANGGGGGNSNNCGGGGGGNGGVVSAWNGMGNPDNSTANNLLAWSREPATSSTGTFKPSSSSGGGRGGYAHSANNADPTSVGDGPNSASVWAGDSRHNDGGWGGTPLDYSGGRVFLGGGGGAGDSNDGNGTSGGNGGGMVYLLSYGTVSGAGQILADGATALSTNWVTGSTWNEVTPLGDDGAGGGGGGGTVLISSSGAITLTNATPISAKGGNGGNYTSRNQVTTSKNFGPGGGGGGGYVSTSSAVTSNVAGGANGIVSLGGGNNTKIAQKFPPNGSTAGGAGTANTSANTFYLTASNYTICAGTSASLTVTANGTAIPNPVTYNWYNTAFGGTPVGTGNPYSTGTLSVGTYTYYAGTCPGSYRIPVIVNVLNAPTVSVTATPTAVCAGVTSTLTASGASSYTWSANAGSGTATTATVSPSVPTTYTVTGANGTCTDTKTVTVNITTAPTVSIASSATTICSGSPVTFTASGATNYTWSANAGSATTATATASPVSNATFTVTGDNGGCIATQTVVVNVTPTPTVSIAASNTVICGGGSVTFTASGATTYTWSANAGNATTATVTVTPGSTDTYTVTGDNGGGCTSTKTITVNVNTTPTVAIAASTTTICSGASVTFTASGAATYTWSSNASSATTSVVTVSPSASDTYTVTGDNTGCTSTQTVSVNVNPTPTVSAVSSATAVCNGTAVTFTASGAANYTWSANAGGVTTATATATPTTTATYTVTGDASGCTATQTVSVLVNNPPTKADSVANQAACGSANGSYVLNSVTGGTGPYQINFNNTGFTNISSFSYTVSGLSAGTYPVVIQDNAGCTYTTSVIINNSGGITQVDSATTAASCNPANSGSIIINSVSGGTSPYQIQVNGGSFVSIPSYPDTIPNLTAGTYTVVVRDANLCQHTSLITVNSLGGITAVSLATQNAQCVPLNSGSITLNSVTGGTGPYGVSLNGSPFIAIPGFPYTVSGFSAGVYTITVQDAAGCPNTSTVTVGSTAGPTNATISTVSDTCGRSVGTLSVTNVVGGTPAYQYSINGSANQVSNVFTGLATGNYTVLVTDNNGCSFVHYDSVKTVGPTVSPVITASGPVNFCQSGSVILSSSIASGNSWNTGATTQTITVNSTDTLSLTVSQFGCTVNSNTVIVTVNPNPTITVSNPVTICEGTSTTLTASGATNYTWSPAAGLSSTSSATVTATPGVAGTYTYVVNATDANSCPGSNTVVVTVAPAPSGAPLVTTPVYYCLHQTATALTATASSGATLNWYDASMNPLSSAPTPATSPMGTTTYYVTQSIGSCTSGKDSIKVTVVAQPDASFTTSPSAGNILAAQSVTFTPNQSPAPYLSFTWDFGDPSSGTSNTSVLINPTHTYNSQGLYCAALVVTSSLTPTCPAANTLCLDVLNGIEITIPNVFSPNGDGINDFFSVKSSGLNTLSCAIYDRWGLKLYQWDGVNGHWDGTEMKGGKNVTDGTYYYIIETTDIKKLNNKHEGYIQLIR